jgi:hypothetical protein
VGEAEKGRAIDMSTKRYNVDKSATGQPQCQCEACVLWTIVYDDPEPTEISTSWVGNEGLAIAEDICDLMNDAYLAGQKASIDNAEESKLVAFFRSSDGGQLGRDGDHDGLTPAETAIRAMRKLLRK